MKYKTTITVTSVAVSFVWFFLFIGYFLNVKNIVENISSTDEITNIFLLQLAGLVLIPLGSILGWIL